MTICAWGEDNSDPGLYNARFSLTVNSSDTELTGSWFSRGDDEPHSISFTRVAQAPAPQPPAPQPTGPAYCQPGQQPEFAFGFAQLKARLGDVMGNPIECEHTNADNGDSLMQTTTGLSFYRKATNTPTFTNGFEHWALTAQGLVYWTGDSIDPPASATPVP